MVDLSNSAAANVLRHGREEALPEQLALHAGPLSLLFEQGDLRTIRLGDREVLRRVYVAIRDQNWDTIPARLSELEVRQDPDGFHITFLSEHVLREVDFAWRGTIEGRPDGTIRYEMDGEARSAFRRNRIGICVLHSPRETAGAPYRVEHEAGSVEEGVFPKLISPHQPIMDIRSLSHEVLPGAWAKVAFEGDVFEMEDQRNWTDASFKTYSTPLALPYPVEIAAGTRIRQAITLSLEGQVPAQPPAELPWTLTVSDEVIGPLPRLGLGSASHGQPLSARELERLKALHLRHLRVDLELRTPEALEALRRADVEARALDVPLEVALLLSDDADAELRGLRRELDLLRPRVTTWLVFNLSEHGTQSTSAQWVTLARQALADYDSAARFGGGPNSNFTELNRQHPPLEVLDLVSFPINPQVHAFDNLSLVENLEAQAWAVESARAICGGLPLAVSPVTLRQRFNPVAVGPEPAPAPGALPDAVDPRQMSLFGAAWTLGSVKYLSEAGVSSVTYYETSGWRGVQETEQGSPLPGRFPSIAGGVFPLYHVLADVGELSAGEVLRVTSSNTLVLDGLALRAAGRTRVLVANLTGASQKASIHDLPARVWIRMLDETTAAQALRDLEGFRAQPGEERSISTGILELDLLPYAVACIDGEGGGMA